MSTVSPNSDFVKCLLDLAEGRLEPEAWLTWWEGHVADVETWVNRGVLLRLRPTNSAAWGPPARAALESQGEACRLLTNWGVSFAKSNRYELQWRKEFDAFCRERLAEEARRKKEFLPIIKSLSIEFPKFASFLRRNLERIEGLAGPASNDEIATCEKTLEVKLPDSYIRFLFCSRFVVFTETLAFGLPYTFPHESPSDARLPTHGMLCFGDCFLEADGDQVLFDLATECQSAEPPIVYYAHGAAPPKVRPLATDFRTWVEGLGKARLFD